MNWYFQPWLPLSLNGNFGTSVVPVAAGKRRGGVGNSRRRKHWRRTQVFISGGIIAALTCHPYLCSSACAFNCPDFQQRTSIHWKAFETSLYSLKVKFIQISDATNYFHKIRKTCIAIRSSNSELSLCFGVFLPLCPPKLLNTFWLVLRFWVQAAVVCWDLPKKQTKKKTNSKFGNRTRQAYENCKQEHFK